MTAPAPTVARDRSAAAEAAGLTRHLVGRVPGSPLWGWLGPLLVTALAGLLRFWRLDQPDRLVFDETYYVKQGYSLLRFGYERRWPEGADDRFVAGAVDVYLAEPDFVVHPPVGKWMIALGQWLLGVDNAWGWRLGAALAGTLSVLLLARVVRRLLGSTLLGTTAGLLLAVDGHHLVHSRTSLLDIFLSFWVLAAFGALLVDRDRSRARLAALAARARAGDLVLPATGPALGLRPWRVVAGVCLGLAVGTKWSGLFFVAAFGLLTVLWDLGARRAAGTPRWWGALWRDGVPAFVSIVGVALVTYVASWAGWLRSEDGHGRQWGAENPDAGWAVLPDALRSLGKYHADIWGFHTTLDSDHPYEAHPWSWLVQGRPTSFFYEGSSSGEGGCLVDSCSRAVTSLGNPVVWWGGTAALVVLLLMWLLRRDWRAGAVWSGVAAGWLPWFYYASADDRTMYTFYAVAFAPFMVMALTYVLGMLVGPREAWPDRTVQILAAGAVVVAAVLMAAWFWPVHVAEVLPYAEWRMRMWFPSWI